MKFQFSLFVDYCCFSQKNTFIYRVRVKRGNGIAETEKRKRYCGKEGKRRKSGKKGKRRKSGKKSKRRKSGNRAVARGFELGGCKG